MKVKNVLTIKGEKYFTCFVNNDYFCYSDRKKIYLYDFKTEKTREINIKKAYSGVVKDKTSLIYDENGNLFSLNLLNSKIEKMDVKVFPDLGLVWYEDSKIIAAEDIDGLNNRLFTYDFESNSKQYLTCEPENILNVYGLNARGELIYTKLESTVQEIICLNLNTKVSKTILKAYNSNIITVNPKNELYVFSKNKKWFQRNRKNFLSDFESRMEKELSIKHTDFTDSSWISKGNIIMLIEDNSKVLFFDNKGSLVCCLDERGGWHDSSFESDYFVLINNNILKLYCIDCETGDGSVFC